MPKKKKTTTKNSMYIFFKDVKINIEIVHADRSGLVRPIIIFIWINFSNTVPLIEKKPTLL